MLLCCNNKITHIEFCERLMSDQLLSVYYRAFPFLCELYDFQQLTKHNSTSSAISMHTIRILFHSFMKVSHGLSDVMTSCSCICRLFVLLFDFIGQDY